MGNFEVSIPNLDIADPVEIARVAKPAFKNMPGEIAYDCFATVMTAAATIFCGASHAMSISMQWVVLLVCASNAKCRAWVQTQIATTTLAFA